MARRKAIELEQTAIHGGTTTTTTINQTTSPVSIIIIINRTASNIAEYGKCN
jgi:hypothetical protein